MIEKVGKSSDASKSMALTSINGYVAPATDPTFFDYEHAQAEQDTSTSLSVAASLLAVLSVALNSF